MATRKVDADTCPLESCDLPPAAVIVTDEGSKLTTANLTQARTCLVPTTVTVGGEDKPGAYISYHDSLDADATEDGADDDDVPDVEDLSEQPRKLFHRVVEVTNANGTVSKAALMGRCADLDMSREYIDDTLDFLVDQGYLATTDEGIRPAEGV